VHPGRLVAQAEGTIPTMEIFFSCPVRDRHATLGLTIYVGGLAVLSIQRKSLLYRSKIPEVGWCINHVLGCSHACRYPCHAFLIKQRAGQIKDMSDWNIPRLVSNAPELLEKELSKMRHLPERVHFSLSTDPFMYHQPEVIALTLLLMRMINNKGVSCSVLTKGVLPAGLADYSRENSYGISLVSLDESFRMKYEPGSAPYAERISGLKMLADKGCSAYVHMEPYPPPGVWKQDLRTVLEAVSFAGEISYFGAWNYNNSLVNLDDSSVREFYNICQKLIRLRNAGSV
jgi:DNA repair photolyase